MATLNPYKAYQQTSVDTSTPGELTLMLYNGALKFLSLAKRGMEAGDIEMKNTNLQKTQNIIREFMVTLDPKQPVAEGMMQMYDYMNRRLIEANVTNDAAIVAEVTGLMTEFRDTWKQVVQIQRQKQYGGAGGV
ncbi:flagellar export chaperone FliS [Indiicoccus explosivorum]|uniref:flagellar export chaperone FliS n=1 Tax=Indiicoccus explosivorum TaxID=1917864 RepID=UPI000B433A5F|nr:flagellar export chaperone FliS [Indiicoccus explosivorum]